VGVVARDLVSSVERRYRAPAGVDPTLLAAGEVARGGSGVPSAARTASLLDLFPYAKVAVVGDGVYPDGSADAGGIREFRPSRPGRPACCASSSTRRATGGSSFPSRASGSTDRGGARCR
jgi:hypothetical protein